ncbi:MAG: hypothetical protein MUP49_01640 [Dehalococcoidia bacterium]|nr:hypothetical protein [Dehalococcoidia bacterium]
MGNRPQLRSSVVEVPETLEAVYRLVMERGWGDGLPVVPPTEDRVHKMLESVDGTPDEVIGEMPPAGAEIMLEKLAVNAVMAGCLPEYFPVVIAVVKAMLEPEFNLLSIQSTTNPVGPLIIINGPIRNKLNINCTRGCMGPGWRANATIGRAIRLVLINIGGALPAKVDMAVHGMPGKYSFCFGEDEEGSPWEPLHVERGFKKKEGTVTVIGVHGTHNSLCLLPSSQAILQFTASAMCTMGNNDILLGKGQPLVVLTSGHAELLVKDGFSKADVKRFLFEHATISVSNYPKEIQEMTEVSSRVVNGMISPCASAEDIIVVIAGGYNPLHTVAMPTFGDTKAITKPIARPS